MDKRIPVDPVEDVKGILLIPQISSPTAEIIPLDDRAYRTVICDFHIAGAQNGRAKPWGYEHDSFDVVDHHAPDPRWETHISSVHLAIEYVRLKGFADKVVINHTDCDSIFPAMILRGLLLPVTRYSAAAEAADHTGEENDLADLLQALEHQRSLLGSMDALDDWLRSEFHSDETKQLLRVRSRERETARSLAAEAEWHGRIAVVWGSSNLDTAFLTPFLKEAWVVVYHFVDPEKDTSVMKVRLGLGAPAGFTLRNLELPVTIPSYGGRWNAGSNHRGGGTDRDPWEMVEMIGDRVRAWDQKAQLERAIAIAAVAHMGQVDKAGNPYVLHPLRVMLRQTSTIAKTVAVLHDVVEDCPGWTFDRLREEGFSEEVLEALDLVTNPPGYPSHDPDAYLDKVRMTAGNPIAKAVKLADIEDNMDLSRIAKPGRRDYARLQKYETALSMLKAMGPRGEDLLPAKSNTDDLEKFIVFSFQTKVTIPCRSKFGQLVDRKTGKPIGFKDGHYFRVQGNPRAFKDVPNIDAYSDITYREFLPKGTQLFVEIDVRDIPEKLQSHVINRATIKPAGSGQLKVNWEPTKAGRGSDEPAALVPVVLVDDLRLQMRGLGNAKAMSCKVKIPSLGVEVQSLNQAYSEISRNFEPWRKSVSGSIYRKVYKEHDDPRRDDQVTVMISLGDLRDLAEASELSRAINGLAPSADREDRLTD